MDATLLKGEEDDAESRSIYVKNLSWSTKDSTLMRHFDGTVSASGGSIRFVFVVKAHVMLHSTLMNWAS